MPKDELSRLLESLPPFRALAWHIEPPQRLYPLRSPGETVDLALRLSEPRGSLDAEVIKPRAGGESVGVLAWHIEPPLTAAEQMRDAHAAAVAAKRAAQFAAELLGPESRGAYLARVASDQAAMAAYRSCAAVDIRRPL